MSYYRDPPTRRSELLMRRCLDEPDYCLGSVSGDGGIDCMPYKRDPVAPMKIVVQAKLYNGTVQPTHVRDLFGTVQHEGATLGIMVTTSGYGPDSWEFINGKNLHLIDGTNLLSICQEHGIPARILNLGKRK